MIGRRVWSYLFPQEEKLDAGSREETERLSVYGLKVVSAVTLVGPVLLLAVGTLFPEFQGTATSFWSFCSSG